MNFQNARSGIFSLVIFFFGLLVSLKGFAAFLSPTVSMQIPGCNATTWAQIPGTPDLFLGRQLIDATAANPCRGDNQEIVIGHMNWNTHQISNTSPIFNLPIQIQDGKYTVSSAYDASVAFFNGEYWIAFECAGANIPTVGTCMAPLDLGRGIDLSRSYMAILGVSSNPGSPSNATASVPSLLSFDGRLILYWNAVNTNKITGVWGTITTRAIDLAPQTDARRRVVPNGYGIEMPADHPLSTEVFGLGVDSNDNNVATAYQVAKMGNNFFLLGSIGGQGCEQPTDPAPGCYRTTVRRSASPIGYHIFNQARIPDAELPSNPSQYLHFIATPNGELKVIGQLLPPNEERNSWSGGLFIFSLPGNSFFLAPDTNNPALDPLAATVTQGYSVFLNRNPDPSGLANWITAIYKGVSIRDFALALFQSAESANRFGYAKLNNSDYINFIYDYLFQRPADAAGMQIYRSLLDNGSRSRLGIFTNLYYSQEFSMKHPFLTPTTQSPVK